MNVNEVKIIQDGGDITGTTQDVIVGQKMNLSLQVEGGGSATNVQWAVPGTRVANYVANENTGTATPLTALTSNSLVFYWIDGGNGRQVTLTCTVNGNPVTKTATFNVMRPTAHISSTTDQVSVNQLGVLIRFGRFPPPGISFAQTVNFPQGFNGQTEWIQVVTPLRRRKTNAGVWQRWTGSGIDSTYPYWGSGDTNDSPAIPLDSSNNNNLIIVEKTVNDSYEMFLMFKPDVANGIWVPLRKVSWSWSADGTYDQNAITLVNSNHSSNPSDADCLEEPEWTRNAASNSWVNE